MGGQTSKQPAASSGDGGPPYLRGHLPPRPAPIPTAHVAAQVLPALHGVHALARLVARYACPRAHLWFSVHLLSPSPLLLGGGGPGGGAAGAAAVAHYDGDRTSRSASRKAPAAFTAIVKWAPPTRPPDAPTTTTTTTPGASAASSSASSGTAAATGTLEVVSCDTAPCGEPLLVHGRRVLSCARPTYGVGLAYTSDPAPARWWRVDDTPDDDSVDVNPPLPGEMDNTGPADVTLPDLSLAGSSVRGRNDTFRAPGCYPHALVSVPDDAHALYTFDTLSGSLTDLLGTDVPPTGAVDAGVRDVDTGVRWPYGHFERWQPLPPEPYLLEPDPPQSSGADGAAAAGAGLGFGHALLLQQQQQQQRLPLWLDRAGAVAWGDSIWVTGGWAVPLIPLITTNIESADARPPRRVQKQGHAAGPVLSAHADAVACVRRFDCKTRAWAHAPHDVAPRPGAGAAPTTRTGLGLAPMRHARADHGTCVWTPDPVHAPHRQLLVVAGGRQRRDGGSGAAMGSLTAASSSSSVVPAPPYATCLRSVEAYDPAQNAWHDLPPLTRAGCLASLVALTLDDDRDDSDGTSHSTLFAVFAVAGNHSGTAAHDSGRVRSDQLATRDGPMATWDCGLVERFDARAQVWRVCAMPAALHDVMGDGALARLSAVAC